MKKALVSIALAATALSAADWLCERGDAKGSGWQKHGTTLNVANVAQMKLLWKRALDTKGSLTAPVILGPTVTHRGVRELVLIAASDDQLFAIDADLGRLFWTRKFETAATKPACSRGLTAAPAIEPDDDEDDLHREESDDPSEMKPIYVLASDGRLHTIRASDGTDSDAAVAFVPTGTDAKWLTVDGDYITVRGTGRCGPAGAWRMLEGGKPQPFQPDAADGRPTHLGAWRAPAAQGLTAPVAVNGLVFIADGTSRLHGYDSTTGKELLTTVPVGGSPTSLAVANGHVCFGTSERTVYCYGIPIER